MATKEFDGFPKHFHKDGFPNRVANTPTDEVNLAARGYKLVEDVVADLPEADEAESTKPTEDELRARENSKTVKPTEAELKAIEAVKPAPKPKLPNPLPARPVADNPQA